MISSKKGGGKKDMPLVQKIKGFLFLLLLMFAFREPLSDGQTLQKIPLFIKDREIWVEVARTPEERARGLMERKNLGKDEGMLFIFESEDYHGFWMKNTSIPLSIAFIDKEGRIVEITDMEPFSLESHLPPKPILYALEMKKGWFKTNRITKGDFIRFSK